MLSLFLPMKEMALPEMSFHISSQISLEVLLTKLFQLPQHKISFSFHPPSPTQYFVFYYPNVLILVLNHCSEKKKMLYLDYCTGDKSLISVEGPTVSIHQNWMRPPPRSQGWSRGFQARAVSTSHLPATVRGSGTCTLYKSRQQCSVRIQLPAFLRERGKELKREDGKLDGAELKGERHYLTRVPHHAMPSPIPEAFSSIGKKYSFLEVPHNHKFYLNYPFYCLLAM